MTRGFDASVPARRPRTKIGRVISELTSEPEARPEVADGRGDRDPTADARAGDAPPDPSRARLGDDAPPVTTTPRERSAREAVAADPATSAPPRVASARDQIGRLRERLAMAAHPPLGVAEPKQTAAAVREVVEALRARVAAAGRERSELASALDETRAALARAEADLRKERKARASIEAQAEERRRIADDAVAEAEALAAERDQVLGELAERDRLDTEQLTLLAEAEVALTQRDTEREKTVQELAEARELLDLRVADVADLEARFEAEVAARARAEARCRELEGEVTRLCEAGEALESIDAIVTRGR